MANTIFNNYSQMEQLASVFSITWSGILAFAVAMVYDYMNHNAAWTCVDGDDMGVQVLLMLNALWVDRIVLE